MDQLERSFQEEQTNLTNRIRIAREAQPSVKPTGYCQNPDCLEDVPEGHLYCDSGCAEGHRKFMARRGEKH